MGVIIAPDDFIRSDVLSPLLARLTRRFRGAAAYAATLFGADRSGKVALAFATRPGAYIPDVHSDRATPSDLLLAAGLAKVLQQYLGSVRLTQ
ncbi:hypothetical protein [Rhizobium sp. G21]|uniref:hypothetical protein n=1 Tax=Rhizobium sp. G21 TaxID=2758439 RepID=UPI0015FF1DB7|nr:hypothetical protein [Rhizobium sp. G21]MBB1248121.1 hypothetical protein [Rhizobium sp. G21]